jgi:hypothetical protein
MLITREIKLEIVLEPLENGIPLGQRRSWMQTVRKPSGAGCVLLSLLCSDLRLDHKRELPSVCLCFFIFLTPFSKYSIFDFES